MYLNCFCKIDYYRSDRRMDQNEMQIDNEQNERIAALIKQRFPQYAYKTIAIFTIWLKYISEFSDNKRHIRSVSSLVESDSDIIECIFKDTTIIQYVFFGRDCVINPAPTVDITTLVVSTEKLGFGTFGKVVAGKVNDKNVAVKTFCNIEKKQIYKQYSEWCVFMKEYALLIKLQNTIVVGKLYGVRWDSDNWQMIVERHYIRSLEWKSHSMNTTENTIQIVRNIFAAINTIHEITGYVHGDVKPDNIMIDIIEDKPVVKIIDFGLSEKIQVLQNDHQYIQTIYWRSPELLEYLPTDLVLADAWATAITVIDIMAGRCVMYDIGATSKITEDAMLALLYNKCLNRKTIPDEWSKYIEPELIDYANEIYKKYIVSTDVRAGFSTFVKG